MNDKKKVTEQKENNKQNKEKYIYELKGWLEEINKKNEEQWKIFVDNRNNTIIDKDKKWNFKTQEKHQTWLKDRIIKEEEKLNSIIEEIKKINNSSEEEWNNYREEKYKNLNNSFGNKLSKQRNQYRHHGIDALAIAYANFIPQNKQTYIVRNNLQSDKNNDEEIEKILLEKFNNTEILKNNYFDNNENFIFHTPVIKKTNLTLHNETLYSA
jgi:hypothetical protein